MNIQRLLVRYPNRIYHQGQTKEDRRLDLREGLPWIYQAAWSALKCQYLVTDLREGRRCCFQQQQSVVKSRINLWNIATHLRFRIFSSTHRKSHKLVWSIYSHDFLSRLWSSVGTWLCTWPAASLSQQSSNLYQRNRPWTSNCFQATLLQFWTTLWDPRINRGYHHKWWQGSSQFGHCSPLSGFLLPSHTVPWFCLQVAGCTAKAIRWQNPCSPHFWRSCCRPMSIGSFSNIFD